MFITQHVKLHITMVSMTSEGLRNEPEWQVAYQALAMHLEGPPVLKKQLPSLKCFTAFQPLFPYRMTGSNANTPLP